VFNHDLAQGGSSLLHYLLPMFSQWAAWVNWLLTTPFPISHLSSVDIPVMPWWSGVVVSQKMAPVYAILSSVNTT